MCKQARSALTRSPISIAIIWAAPKRGRGSGASARDTVQRIIDTSRDIASIANQASALNREAIANPVNRQQASGIFENLPSAYDNLVASQSNGLSGNSSSVAWDGFHLEALNSDKLYNFMHSSTPFNDSSWLARSRLDDLARAALKFTGAQHFRTGNLKREYNETYGTNSGVLVDILGGPHENYVNPKSDFLFGTFHLATVLIPVEAIALNFAKPLLAKLGLGQAGRAANAVAETITPPSFSIGPRSDTVFDPNRRVARIDLTPGKRAPAHLAKGAANESAYLAAKGLPKNTSLWRPSQSEINSPLFKEIVGEAKYTPGGKLKGTIFDSIHLGNHEVKFGSSTLHSSYQLRLQTYRSVSTDTPFTVHASRDIGPKLKDFFTKYNVSVVRAKIPGG